jgi:hypothetical protein
MSPAEYSEDGVDLTLIRWMLSLSPAQRLAVLQDQVDSLLTLRAKFESAVYRSQPERQLRPGESHLSGEGHQLLLTKFGALDVLGMIGKSRDWDDLREHSRAVEVEPGILLQVLDLETLIAVKEELGFPKDLAVLPILKQALKERSGQS